MSESDEVLKKVKEFFSDDFIEEMKKARRRDTTIPKEILNSPIVNEKYIKDMEVVYHE